MKPIAGCVSKHRNFTDGDSLYPGHGILAVGLQSNWSSMQQNALYPELDLYYSSIDDKYSPPRKLTFLSGEEMAVVELPAGKYFFTRLTIGTAYLELFNTGFEVRADAITYIGDISATIRTSSFAPYRAAIEVKDEFTRMQQYLADAYPGLSDQLVLEKSICCGFPLSNASVDFRQPQEAATTAAAAVSEPISKSAADEHVIPPGNSLTGTYASNIVTTSAFTFRDRFRNIEITFDDTDGRLRVLRTSPEIRIRVSREGDRVSFSIDSTPRCGCGDVIGFWNIEDEGARLSGEWERSGGIDGKWVLTRLAP